MSSARYAVSQKIDSGGMAEVWMGRARTNDGFVRPVAIKRVLPHLVGLLVDFALDLRFGWSCG